MNGAVVTIGNFDGVHRGHQYVLGQVVKRARSLGLASFAVTFDPDPEEVLHPERTPAYLTDLEQKLDLLRQFGIDDVWVCQFTKKVAGLGPREFMTQVGERQPISELWVGADFALGRGRSGTSDVLTDIGTEQGWTAHKLPPFRYQGAIVSSTAIREALRDGDVRRAAALLGRDYAVRVTIRGNGAAGARAVWGGELRPPGLSQAGGSGGLHPPEEKLLPLPGEGAGGGEGTSLLEVKPDLAVPGAASYAAVLRQGSVRTEAIATTRPLSVDPSAGGTILFQPLEPTDVVVTGTATLSFVGPPTPILAQEEATGLAR